MSAWELAGPLLLLCSMPDTLFGKQLIIWVDNSGSVMMFEKGYSTKCNLCCTLIVAINDVSRAIGCDVEIRKIRRCSNAGAVAADNLSKANLREFHDLMPRANKFGSPVPTSFLSWIQDPVPDRFLGRKIVNEMAQCYKIVSE